MVDNEEKILKERLRYVLHSEKCPIARFAKTETDRARFGRQINGDASVPFSTILMVLRMFPDVSAEWLIRGEGQMSKTEEKQPTVYTTANVHDNYAGGDINISQGVENQKELEDLRKQLDEVSKDRDFLKGLLMAMTPQK